VRAPTRPKRPPVIRTEQLLSDSHHLPVGGDAPGEIESGRRNVIGETTNGCFLEVFARPPSRHLAILVNADVKLIYIIPIKGVNSLNLSPRENWEAVERKSFEGRFREEPDLRLELAALPTRPWNEPTRNRGPANGSRNKQSRTAMASTTRRSIRGN
jgi:hypothetical protein